MLQKLSLFASYFLGCFIRKIAIICTIPWFSTCCISKSSTRWYILLFIVSFILPYTTQKSRFHKIDMDFGFVASTLKYRVTKLTLTYDPSSQNQLSTSSRHQQLTCEVWKWLNNNCSRYRVHKVLYTECHNWPWTLTRDPKSIGFILS